MLTGTLSLGTLLGLAALAAGLLEPLATLVATGFQLQLLGGYLDRIDDVLDTAPEQHGTPVRPAPQLRGAITAEHLRFRYAPNAPLVIDDVSLAVPPGSSLAIVGRSGSGKTTLAHLLLGLYPPDDGHVRHDGHDLAELDVRTVRTQLGVVTQEPYLFAVSVRQNIALTRPDATLDEVRAAAALACVDGDIEAMAMSYDTILVDGGGTVSGGQRQRIALARALVGRPAVLLLDEATSQLDTITEARVQANLAQLGCTTIVVAHRLSTVRHADQIVVVDGGRVVERGTHAELLARGGHYAALAAAQRDGDGVRTAAGSS